MNQLIANLSVFKYSKRFDTSIWLIDGNLKVASVPGQSWLGNYGLKRCSQPSLKLQDESLLFRFSLVSSPEHSFGILSLWKVQETHPTTSDNWVVKIQNTLQVSQIDSLFGIFRWFTVDLKVTNNRGCAHLILADWFSSKFSRWLKYSIRMHGFNFFNHLVTILFVSKVGDRTQGRPEGSLSIATTQRCRGGCYSFLLIAPPYPWYVPYIAEC